MILTALGMLLVLLLLSVPVAAGLGFLGLGLTHLFTSLPLWRGIGELSWSTSNNFLLVAIPYFVLLGELLLRTGMAERMYTALVHWIPGLPGGIMHTNVVGCALFSATSGSSVATAATIGTVAMTQIEKGGYSERLFLGTIAAGGTLGILLPPSINLIVYGVLTNSSIPQLYLAGILPGTLLAVLFSAVIVVACVIRPRLGGNATRHIDWRTRLRTLPDLLPPVVIFVAVIGSIYAGWATATEAAGLGVAAALGLAALYRCLTWTALWRALEGTVRTTAMIMAIMITAHFLNMVFAAVGIVQVLIDFFDSMDVTPVTLLLIVVVLYLILGMFLETLSMMVLTVPIVAPILFQAGFDPIWVGILVVILMEVALITPPVGMNIFVVQSLRSHGKVSDIFIGVLPFVVVMLLLVGLISVWPQIVLWLPQAIR